MLGDQVTLLALPVVAVQQLHAGAAEMGYLAAAAWLPFLIVALPAGAWVDRRRHRRPLMIAADLGRVLLLASVPLSFGLHLLSLPQLFLVALLAGSFAVLFDVSYPTLLASLVERERYAQGQALINGSRALAAAAGPALGGVLVQLVGGPLTLLADSVSFLASVLSLGRLKVSEPQAAGPEAGQFLGGLRFIYRSAIMRSALAATATVNLFVFGFEALFILFAVRDLHLAPGVVGLVLGGGAVGALVGSVLTLRIVRRLGLGPTFIAGCIVFAAPLAAVPFAVGPSARSLVLLAAVEFISGLGVMMLDISLGSIFLALIPDRLRSRVRGAYTVVNFGARPLGATLAGLLGSLLGVRQTLLVLAIGGTLAFVWLLPSPFPRLRELPKTAD